MVDLGDGVTAQIDIAEVNSAKTIPAADDGSDGGSRRLHQAHVVDGGLAELGFVVAADHETDGNLASHGDVLGADPFPLESVTGAIAAEAIALSHQFDPVRSGGLLHERDGKGLADS